MGLELLLETAKGRWRAKNGNGKIDAEGKGEGSHNQKGRCFLILLRRIAFIICCLFVCLKWLARLSTNHPDIL